MSQPTFRRLSRPHLARIGLGSIVLAIVLTGAVNVSRTEAATVTVTCSSSPCSASLIQTAIDGASTGDTISIGAGTYQGDVLVNKSVTLQAVPGTVTIDGQNTASHLGTTVTVGPAAVVATIDGLTITGGYADTATQWGGGLRNNGTLTVRNSTITGNNGGTTEGGGIFNASTLTIIDSTITDNTSSNGGGHRKLWDAGDVRVHPQQQHRAG